MRKTLTTILISALSAALFSVCDGTAEAGNGRSRFLLEVEPAVVFQTVNDIQIPNNEEGTRFSLYDLAGNAAGPAFRVYLSWHFSEKQTLRLLAAPLTIEEDVVLAGPVSFAGGDFTPGTSCRATYRFDSYRLTWHYRFYSGESSEWNIGFTAKIRDAVIRLEQEGLSSSKTDLGFVPLLHLSGRAGLGGSFFITADLDAIAGGPGRAEDISLRIGRFFGDRVRMSAGYRMVEGGADVEEVYTFAWLHYFVLSFGVQL